jgi:hypothetical protein
MLEEETKWQQLFLQNKGVKSHKFSLFSWTIVAATRLYKALFYIYFVFFSSFLTTTKIIYSLVFYFCYYFYLDYLMGLTALPFFF